MRGIPWKLVLKTALVPAPQGQAAHEANMGKELWFQPPTALEHRHIWQHRHSWPPSPPHAVDNCCGPAKWKAHALSSVSCTHCLPTKLPICAGIRADESPTGQCPMVGIFQRCQERKYIFCRYRDFALCYNKFFFRGNKNLSEKPCMNTGTILLLRWSIWQ